MNVADTRLPPPVHLPAACSRNLLACFDKDNNCVVLTAAGARALSAPAAREGERRVPLWCTGEETGLHLMNPPGPDASTPLIFALTSSPPILHAPRPGHHSPRPHPAGAPAVSVPVVPDRTAIPWLQDAKKCIAPLMWGRECIGTICRIRSDGVFATARHCVLDGSRCLEGLSAFGSDLTFVAAFPRLDLAFFRGREGPAFSMAVGVWAAGDDCVPVQLASYPHQVLGEETPASFLRGQITSSAASGSLAVVDYGPCE